MQNKKKENILGFVFVLTTIVALVLSLLYTGLKSRHKLNEAIYAKKAILAAVKSKLGKDPAKMSIEEVQKVFSNSIEQEVFTMDGKKLTPDEVEAAGYPGGKAENVDMAAEMKKTEKDRLLPLYVFKGKDGKKYYILSVRGKGLWDEIWGNIALEDDLNTIAGVDFDHRGETPGLGAEIKDNNSWKKQFVGKKIWDPKDGVRGISVVKGGAKDPTWQVDGISGATLTGNGVDEMLKRGLKYYEPILKSLKS